MGSPRLEDSILNQVLTDQKWHGRPPVTNQTPDSDFSSSFCLLYTPKVRGPRKLTFSSFQDLGKTRTFTSTPLLPYLPSLNNHQSSKMCPTAHFQIHTALCDCLAVLACIQSNASQPQPFILLITPTSMSMFSKHKSFVGMV